MGAIADAALKAGGEAIGVIPQHLMTREIGHKRLTKLPIVHSMHERKALMADLADAFIALPGGFGTLEEFFEVLTWSQLGLHVKPCRIINVLEYCTALLGMLEHAVEERFLKSQNRALVLACNTPSESLEALKEFRPVQEEKWLNRSTR